MSFKPSLPKKVVQSKAQPQVTKIASSLNFQPWTEKNVVAKPLQDMYCIEAILLNGRRFQYKPGQKLLCFEWSPPWHFIIYLAYLSGIPSGMSSDILSGISSDILPGIASDILSGILSGISFGILSGGWGPAGNAWRAWSWLRSGGGGRRQEAAWGGRRRGRRRKSTDIKSNNPHLAGGEKIKVLRSGHEKTRVLTAGQPPWNVGDAWPLCKPWQRQDHSDCHRGLMGLHVSLRLTHMRNESAVTAVSRYIR